MNPPNVKHVVRDEAKSITYKLWAYRQLSAREVRFHTLDCIELMKKKPKRNSTYDFLTVIGAGGT